LNKKTIPTDIENGKNIGRLAIDSDHNIIHADTQNKTVHVFTSDLNENNEYLSGKFTINNVNDMYGIKVFKHLITIFSYMRR
jgi:hypothetical protein